VPDALALRTGESRSSFVSRTCAILCPYEANSRSYISTSSHWPTAAAACFSSVESGFPTSPIFASPQLTAPEETSRHSLPLFCMSAMQRTSRSVLRRFISPLG